MRVEVSALGAVCTEDCPYLDIQVNNFEDKDGNQRNSIYCTNREMCRYIVRRVFDVKRRSNEQRKSEADNLHGQKP